MSPLHLLALIFISAAPEEEEDEERKKKEKYDLLFRRGDLLEVPRTLFTHFGIYLGGGRVAHFIPDILPVVSSDPVQIRQMVTNTRLILGVLAKCGSVRVDSVEDFAYGAEIVINPMDKMCSRAALRGEEVARRAERLRGDVAYSLLWYNCEHFVMYCRYGTVVSFQTFQFCKTLRKMLLSRRVAAATAVLAAGALVYLGPVDTWSVLLVLLLPFLLWMAS
ncbi:lecithin retinol acyltransferase b, tandem duplicate 2 [Kryptolebias marmoratus]|uniref:Lecithin retinol acyltransferase b, tandem duplicate 2 n=1 Tax=Kryptolebias marmoratus TaxID=37003 RepID=A0A3Q3B7K6_KRYMA|nr:lecithin retinol acyltransferase b, tandem duplicate 2 [Kryptolebias marmoratus]